MIDSPIGPIQFGVPPETIKDSMGMGLSIPVVFVVPKNRFDRRRGVNLAEIEFPAYYNYFILKRRIRIVVEDETARDRVQAVFQESFFGPGSWAGAEEYDPGFPAAARPDFRKEMSYFRRQADGRKHEVGDLMEFLTFDAARRVDLGGGVTIAREEDDSYVVLDGDQELGRAPASVALPHRPSRAPSGKRFEPPAFGITVLGASHGFDPNGKTTGFVLWIGHRGILIDPPVDTTEHLRERGVMPSMIDGVILTHCHADHDSGVFSKLLEEGRIMLLTTPTILGSFLRKYSALSDIDEKVLRRTFKYYPVKIGSPTPVLGADIFFHYTLHSIPALGFEVFYGGKTLAFSGDTLFDPAKIWEIAAEGVMTEERRDSLLSFPWHHSVVLHEAGVPPLHTPTESLAALPPDVKERLYLVHIARKDVPEGKDLKAAEVGVENTIAIDVEPAEHRSSAELLDLFCNIDFFRELPLSRARELLGLVKRRVFKANARIITQGSEGDEFFLLVSGWVSVLHDGQEIKAYHPGEYFGETALVLRQPRTADVVARSDVEALVLDRHGFLYLLRGTDIPSRLVRLARAREDRSWQVVEENATLSRLTSAQKTQLQTYLVAREVTAGETLWKAGDPAEAAYLVEAGAVVLTGASGDYPPFGRGALLAEVDALQAHEPHQTSAAVTEAGKVFRLDRAGFTRFLKQNPGVMLSFMGAQFID